MRPDDLDTLMRAGEAYHGLRVPPGCWAVVRVDGRSFTRLTNDHYERPFDQRFHTCMVASAEALLTDFGGLFAVTHSDEISILLPRDWGVFDREVEKAVSVAAGVASGVFSQKSGHVAAFDGRVWVGATDQQVADYFSWRSADALRSGINSLAYWTLRGEGMTERQATATLFGKGFAEKNELLFARGINFNDCPTWQKRGTGLFWESFEKNGHNPVTGEDVTVMRRRVRVDHELPAREEYRAVIASMLAEQEGAV